MYLDIYENKILRHISQQDVIKNIKHVFLLGCPELACHGIVGIWDEGGVQHISTCLGSGSTDKTTVPSVNVLILFQLSKLSLVTLD